MSELFTVLNYICLALTTTSLIFFLITSLIEKELRATLIALIFLFANSGFWSLIINYNYLPWVKTLNLIIFFFIPVFSILSLLKFFPGSAIKRDLSEISQYDERDNMFSRNNLQNHPELMKEYYSKKPDLKKTDQIIHNKPEFGSDKHKYYDYYATPCFEAAFEYMGKTIPASTGTPAVKKKEINQKTFANTIREIALYYGACDVGFTPLKKHHFYSFGGRHAGVWGKNINNKHSSAVVITLPMDVNMLKNAPSNTVIQESAKKYVEAGTISNIIAAYIRNFGYDARAHNDANYQVLCVPLAIDAGLGELGRMGILVHRVFGPCIRISVVTTEVELPPSEINDHHIESFCQICKKCSDNCPTNSICQNEEPVSNGFKHWSINQEKCFSFWKEIGSDCGFCITVCPYTKPNTLIHKLVRFYISRNIINQHIALFFDDLFYGRKPEFSKKNPKTIF